MFTVESQGAVDVVKPMAPLNHENAASFLETIQHRLSKGQPMVVLDMSEVPLVDSAGLDSLLDVQQAIQLRGGTIKLAAIPQLCCEILRITGVDQRFETFLDIKSAVGSYVQ
ncbi:MAG: STAS domain-containing protein [Planctomycetales bacterium]|nr:STAS domain-containing protein [Planctomycetales bacterium]